MDRISHVNPFGSQVGIYQNLIQVYIYQSSPLNIIKKEK